MVLVFGQFTGQEARDEDKLTNQLNTSQIPPQGHALNHYAPQKLCNFQTQWAMPRSEPYFGNRRLATRSGVPGTPGLVSPGAYQTCKI